jgi:hypothetical protein
MPDSIPISNNDLSYIMSKKPFWFLLVIIVLAGLSLLRLIARAADKPKLETGALMTGKTLYLFCTSRKAEDQFTCQSYIAGVIDYHRLLRGLGTAPTVDFCLPPAIDMAQIKKIVAAYLASRTEHRDFVAAPRRGDEPVRRLSLREEETLVGFRFKNRHLHYSQ